MVTRRFLCALTLFNIVVCLKSNDSKENAPLPHVDIATNRNGNQTDEIEMHPQPPKNVPINTSLVSKDFLSGNTFNLLGSSGCEGPALLKQMSGTVSSPNYPEPYGNNVSCLWIIQAPADHLIHISFQDFELEHEHNVARDRRFKCPFDYLYIFESYMASDKTTGHDEYSRRRRSWGRFCGYQPPKSQITSYRGSLMYLYFHSDSSGKYRGFHLTYHMIKLDGKDGSQVTHFRSGDSLSDIPSERKAEKELQLFAFGFTTLLFCIVGFAAVIRLFQNINRNENRNALRNAWTFSRNLQRISPSEMQLQPDSNTPPRLPTPPPRYQDVVKTDEDWLRVSQQLGESSAVALRRQFEAEELQVSYEPLEILQLNEATPEASASNQVSTSPINNNAEAEDQNTDNDNRVESG
jgi:hypothetical protein